MSALYDTIINGTNALTTREKTDREIFEYPNDEFVKIIEDYYNASDLKSLERIKNRAIQTFEKLQKHRYFKCLLDNPQFHQFLQKFKQAQNCPIQLLKFFRNEIYHNILSEVNQKMKLKYTEFYSEDQLRISQSLGEIEIPTTIARQCRV